jgi:S-adenosyl methyltransferase
MLRRNFICNLPSRFRTRLEAIMRFIADREDPAGITAIFRDSLCAGSSLAHSHVKTDLHPEDALQATAVYDQVTSTVTPRSHAQLTALFGGGDDRRDLRAVQQWRPDQLTDGELIRRRDELAAGPQVQRDHRRA